MRSLADRLEAVRRTLPAVADTGQPAETAWPMTHLVGIVAEASDEYLFRVADPEADRTVLAAFATAVAQSGQALSCLATASEILLGSLPGRTETARHSLNRADDLSALAARGLITIADRLSCAAAAPAIPLPADELHRRRTAQATAAIARSRIVSAQPASTGQPEPATPTAPVIPLRRGH
ncbi:hypothetical protein ABTX81_01810 [Kitasatospora sp. NPDC097605]|uniref:hypothetical protein n=1 Tax=Kitasatospora sp. NPDC097605 TaxID=3157226 RepID=UPI003330DF45